MNVHVADGKANQNPKPKLALAAARIRSNATPPQDQRRDERSRTTRAKETLLSGSGTRRSHDEWRARY